MIPIVIPLKDAPDISDWEITYCLRSIEKYYDTDVFIVTGNPRPFSVNYINYPDRGNCRYEAVRQKILKACRVLNAPFLLFNDDMFLLKPLDIPPHYYDGMLADRIKGNNTYAKMLKRTADHGDGCNYCLHVPMLIDPEIFERATIPGTSFRCVYASHSDHPKEQMKDVKLRTRKDHRDFERFIDGLPFFSTAPMSIGFISKQMREMYPEPSRWE